MPDNVHVEIKGLARLQAALRQFPGVVARDMSAAGKEAAEEILKTPGVRTYPGQTPANAPPVPYYIRGRGTETASGNLGNSEKLGTQWNVQRGWSTRIGNRASYAGHVHGEKQAAAMGVIGWVKLKDAALMKLTQVRRTYNRWVKYTLAKLGI